MRGVIFLLVLFLFSASLAFAKDDFNVIALREEDGGGEVDLRKGDFLVLLLREVSGSGFRWEVVSFDRGKLLFLSSQSVSLSLPGVVGGTGLRVLAFKAVGSGRTPLRIVYHRPWETLKPPLKEFCVDLNIR